MKHILFLATGGTLSCRQSENGLSPALTGEQLLQYLPEIADFCTVTVENPYSVAVSYTHLTLPTNYPV